MSAAYDINEAGPREYDFGLRAWREREIRAGRMAPLTEQEFRWVAEGEVPPGEMDSARNG